MSTNNGKSDEITSTITDTEARRVKLAIGGAVLELVRKWGVTGIVAWMAAQQGIIPGFQPRPGQTPPPVLRSEFETYIASHKQWGEEVVRRMDGRLENIERGQLRMEQRIDRALDKRLAAAP